MDRRSAGSWTISIGRRPRRPLRRGATLIDVAIAVAVLGMLVAAALPVLRRARGDAGEIVSATNLATMGVAHALYGFDWNDRQVTFILDEAGSFGGDCQAYVDAPGCAPSLTLGYDAGFGVGSPTLWGYFIGECSTPGSCVNWIVQQPIAFMNPAVSIGSFRLPNAIAFHDYVGGRFYDETFYAPNDFVTYQQTAPFFFLASEFTANPPDNTIFRSSYCLSPAAMFDPEVLGFDRRSGGWFRSPTSYDEGFTSPTAGQCAFPDLKTRMLEHNWCFNPPSKTNPAFLGTPTPYYFTQGVAASPMTLFFDGHVANLPNADVVAGDDILRREGGPGLWSRDTPFGDGYFVDQGFDGVPIGHHVFTIDGILGRDVLGVEPRHAAPSIAPPPFTPHRSRIVEINPIGAPSS